MELFEALTRIRRSQNLTIADVSQRSGLPMSTLSKVFSGISDNPSYTAIVMEHELYRTSSDTQAEKPLGRAEEQRPMGSDIIPASQAQEIDQTDAEAAR